MSDQSLAKDMASTEKSALSDKSSLQPIDEICEVQDDSDKPHKSLMSSAVRDAINLGHKCAALLGARCVSQSALSRSYGQASLRFTCR